MITIEEFINRFNPCDAGVEYLKNHQALNPYEIWNKCMYGDWMLWTAVKLEVDELLIRKAAVICVLSIKNLPDYAADACYKCIDFCNDPSPDNYDNWQKAKDRLNCYYINAAGRKSAALYVALRSMQHEITDDIAQVPKLLYWYNNGDHRSFAFCAGVCQSVLTGVVFAKIKHM